VALPKRRQQLAKFIYNEDLTRTEVAAAIGVKRNRLANLIKGRTYPTPDECRALSRLFNNMPYQALFDAEMLEYFDSWPPPRGVAMKQDREAKKAAKS
jgi:transcriptional regulator with XRE-family HTH domain